MRIFARTLALIPLTLAAATVSLTLGGCQGPRPVETIRDSGDHRFRSGDFAGARDEYAEIVSRHPGDWQAQYKLGLAQIQTKEYPRARQALETAYTLRPTQEIASALAQSMFLQRDESRLFAFLRERASTTRTTDAWLELGRYAMESNDPDTAKVAFETAIEVDQGRSAAPYVEAAKLAERLGNLEEAVRRLSQAYGINPYDTRVHEMLRRMGEDPAKVKPVPPGR